MKRTIKSIVMTSIIGLVGLGFLATPAMSGGNGPADGYTIHVQAPHMMADGTVGGPYHHYCKGIQKGEILQCMLFKTTAPDARLVAVEYFIARISREKTCHLSNGTGLFTIIRLRSIRGGLQFLILKIQRKCKPLRKPLAKQTA